MKKAVIFDMDGVLVDSEPGSLRQRQYYLKSLGLALNEPQLRRMIGANLRQLWPQLLPGKTAKDYAELQAGYLEFKLQHPLDYARLLNPGVKELLSRLRDLQVQTAIASASDRVLINRFLAQNQFEADFKVVVSAQDVSASKPDPAVYLEALRQLKCTAAETLVVEDSKPGISAGKAAGIQTLAVPIADPDFQQDQTQADAQLPNILAVIDYLK